jgi:DNA mismatch repair ATPase MutL
MYELLKYPIGAIIVALISYFIGKNNITVLEATLIGLVSLITAIIIEVIYGYIYRATGHTQTQQAQARAQDQDQAQTQAQDQAQDHDQSQAQAQAQPKKDVPFQFSQDKPSEPAPFSSENQQLTPISNITSRWMDWDPSQGPLNTNTDQYMLYPGYYASIMVRPGYHDNIMTANIDQLNKLSPRIWEMSNPLDRNKYNYQASEIIGQRDNEKGTEEMSGGGDASRGNGGGASQGRGNEMRDDDMKGQDDQPLDDVRLIDVVYSGDLIELSSGQAVLQRATTNSQLLLDTPLPHIRSNLSKLRLENAVKKDYSLTPIRYGDNIHIKHNALIDNTNKTRFIKYGERLQSHQDGQSFEVFKIYRKNNMTSRDYVKYGDEFLIACGDQTGDKIYLKLENDRTISPEGVSRESIPFTIKLVRPISLSSLCVCPDETIYP